MQEKITKIEKLEIDDAYVPQSASVVAIEEHMWIQVLSTIDVNDLSKGTQFYDEMGYDVRPILMISIKPNVNKDIECEGHAKASPYLACIGLIHY